MKDIIKQATDVMYRCYTDNPDATTVIEAKITALVDKNWLKISLKNTKAVLSTSYTNKAFEENEKRFIFNVLFGDMPCRNLLI